VAVVIPPRAPVYRSIRAPATACPARRARRIASRVRRSAGHASPAIARSTGSAGKSVLRELSATRPAAISGRRISTVRGRTDHAPRSKSNDRADPHRSGPGWFGLDLSRYRLERQARSHGQSGGQQGVGRRSGPALSPSCFTDASAPVSSTRPKPGGGPKNSARRFPTFGSRPTWWLCRATRWPWPGP